MRKHILFLISLLTGQLLLAQTEMSRTEFDLGEISLLNADIVDFDISNVTAEDIYILRIDAEQEVGIQYTSKTIRQGNTESLRIKLNPPKKGKITRKILIYLSSEVDPIELSISGNVKALPKNNKQACPQFGKALTPPSGKVQAVAKIQKFPVALYDESSGEQLANVEVAEEVQTEQSPLETKRSTRPVRARNQKRVRKSPEERRNSPSLGKIFFGKEEDSTLVTNEKPEPIKSAKEAEQPKVVEEIEEVTEEQIVEETINEEADEDNLLDNSYKPNNIVFLIDASNSMKEEERLDILKKAMIKLLEPLRDIDYLSIIVYSGDAKVILSPTSGNEKDEIAAQINQLKADGSTNAVKGIKKAIQVGKSNFIEDGNNQIILATDGAFDIGSKNFTLRKKIKNTAEDGLTITVLGIKNERWTNKSLKEIVELGQGELIKINNDRDASKVLKQVKKKSLR